MEKLLKADIDSKNWISIYIYYLDDITLGLMYVRRLIINQFDNIERWFFIRYFDDGIHIRLRVLFKSNVSNRKKVLFINSIENLTKFKRLQITNIKLIAYLPETKRYGGERLLNYAEEHFKLSSENYLSKLTKKGYDKRLEELIVLNLIILTAFGLNVDEINSLNYKMYNYWLPGFNYFFPKIKNPEVYFRNKITKDNKIWIYMFQKIIENDINNNIKLKNWYNVNNILANKYYRFISKKELLNHKKYNNILPSLIHMNNNRFGITNYEEAYIFYITYYITSKFKTS